jgi:CHC2 zinc finger
MVCIRKHARKRKNMKRRPLFLDKKYIDTDQYKDRDTLLKLFRSYGCTPVVVGKNKDQYVCFSPFNKERTPSCRIASIKNGKNGQPVWGYKDFSSGSGGDVFTLIMEKQNIDFALALWVVRKRIAPFQNPQYFEDPMQLEIPFPKHIKLIISHNHPF